MKSIIFILFSLPLFITLYELFILENINDPIKYIYTVSGATATVILFFTISISMIKKE